MEDAVLAESANTIEDVLTRQCQCTQIVDSIKQINQQPGCSGDIDVIDDIVDTLDYNQPLGKHVCELEETSKLFKNDLLLVSQLSSDLAWTSRKISFKDLKSQLLKDLVAALELGTMAYEDKDHWALTSHNHDGAYNKVEWHPNPEYTEHTTDVSCLAMIHISTETLTATDIDHNPKDSHVEQHLSVNCPIIQNTIPSEPFVGTLRFVSAPTLQKLIDGNHLHLSVDGIQVNPYDDDNHIRLDFDGWVFPNGTSISNYNNQLSDAAFVFASNKSAESFTVPTLTSFFESCGEPNGYSIAEEPQVIGLARHEHSVSPIALSCDVEFNRDKTRIYSTSDYGGKNYIHQGGNGTLSAQKADIQLPLKFKDKITNLSTTIDGSESSEQYWPAHNLIPIMIYIGGVLKEHYANIS